MERLALEEQVAQMLAAVAAVVVALLFLSLARVRCTPIAPSQQPAAKAVQARMGSSQLSTLDRS
jgi:hypothetical protein